MALIAIRGVDARLSVQIVEDIAVSQCAINILAASSQNVACPAPFADRATVLRELEPHEQVIEIRSWPSRRAQRGRLLPVVIARPAPQHRLAKHTGR